MTRASLGWLGIARLGLVQTALGSIVVLTTSTMNRVMVVELALPALLPGLLVALHYAVQILRPRLGYCSDVGGRRTPWIVGGMAILALGGIGAAVATSWMAASPIAGIALATLAFACIGIGVGATGTSLLVLLAERVDDRRRAAAASLVWVMMIAGFVITATTAGHFLDPFSPTRLIVVTSVAAGAAFVLTVLAVRNIESRGAAADGRRRQPEPTAHPAFREALAQVWAEPQARRFAIFVFISMLAYSGQDLILEPFAGAVFGLTPGESTKLAGVQHAGVLAGMIVVALAGSAAGNARAASMRVWTMGGCILSAAALASLATAAFVAPDWPLRGSVFVLGLANGAFAIAAIASMMRLVGAGRASREGVRMGLWGAAQAIAFGLGGVVGTAAVDLARQLTGSPSIAYASVFAGEALLFVIAAGLAARVYRSSTPPASMRFATTGDGLAGGLDRA
ncbi:MAG: BCD family MFS transporter [Rhodospirillales bacterium]|jgi:BCD family chlorophyll transporter-like MFS transporter|nr:BCD family MFS transporter [Rhodospirillales bacterium]